MKTVLVVMSAEFFHSGHLNIIKTARELGEVTVGLATDEFNGRYKRVSVLSYDERKAIVENMKGVERVIPQDTLDLAPILRELKPDYFVHGDDWKTGPLASVRRQVKDPPSKVGGCSGRTYLYGWNLIHKIECGLAFNRRYPRGPHPALPAVAALPTACSCP